MAVYLFVVMDMVVMDVVVVVEMDVVIHRTHKDYILRLMMMMMMQVQLAEEYSW